MTTPTIYNLATDYARFGLIESEAQRIIGNRFEWREGKTPQFIVCHIQAGTTKSSLDWWANGPGVQASATVMIQHDGSILKIIPEQHGPWTNGDDANPTPNGQRLVSLPGNSNLYTLSIEAEGMSGIDTTTVQLDAIEWQVRKWMGDYDLPLANVIQHADVNSVTRPNCAGAYYPIIMKRLATTAGEIEPYALPWDRGDLGGYNVNGNPAFGMLIEVMAIDTSKDKKGVALRIGADSKAKVGKRVPHGTKAVAIGSIFTGSKWAVIDLGDGKKWRSLAAHWTPKVPTP